MENIILKNLLRGITVRGGIREDICQGVRKEGKSENFNTKNTCDSYCVILFKEMCGT